MDKSFECLVTIVLMMVSVLDTAQTLYIVVLDIVQMEMQQMLICVKNWVWRLILRNVSVQGKSAKNALVQKYKNLAVDKNTYHAYPVLHQLVKELCHVFQTLEIQKLLFNVSSKKSLQAVEIVHVKEFVRKFLLIVMPVHLLIQTKGWVKKRIDWSILGSNQPPTHPLIWTWTINLHHQSPRPTSDTTHCHNPLLKPTMVGGGSCGCQWWVASVVVGCGGRFWLTVMDVDGSSCAVILN